MRYHSLITGQLTDFCCTGKCKSWIVENNEIWITRIRSLRYGRGRWWKKYLKYISKVLYKLYQIVFHENEVHVYNLLKKIVKIFIFLFSVVECTVKWGIVRGKVIRNSILKIWFTGKWWQLVFSLIGRNIQRKGNKNIFMSPLSHVVVCFIFPIQ